MKIKDSTVAKFFMTVGFLETKDLYSKIKTKDQFTSLVLETIGETPLKNPLKLLFDELYDYHNLGDNPDYVWVNTSGAAFMNLYKESAALVKRGMNKAEIKSKLFPRSPIDENPPPIVKPPKHGWINLFRKIIDLVDNEFGGGAPIVIGGSGQGTVSKVGPKKGTLGKVD